MPDQLFEHFHLETTPPPVEAVRRRGERRRRRTAAAVALGAGAALVAVAAPITLLAGGADRGEPSPAHSNTVRPSSPVGWVTTIPQSFDLTAGMATSPAPTQRTIDPNILVFYGAPIPIDIGGCDAPLWSYADHNSNPTLVAQWADGTAAKQVRSLSPYADGAAATAAFDRIQQGVGGCPGGPLSPVPVTLDGTALPGQAFAWVQPKRTGATTSTGTAYVVEQVGNVLLIDRATMTGAGDAHARRLTVDHLAERLSGVTAAAAAAFPTPAS